MSNKKLIVIGAAALLALIVAAIAIFGIQNSNRTKAINANTEAIEQQTANDEAARQEEAKRAEEEKKAREEAEKSRHEDQERIAEAIENNRPAPEGCKTISWTATEQDWKAMPMSKEEVYNLSRQSSYGTPVYINGKVTEIVATLIIRDLYSPSPIQTIVWLKYQPNEDADEIAATILLKGEYACEEIDDLPGGLNYQRKCCTRCITYGGKFYHTPNYEGVMHDNCTTRTKGCKDCGDVATGDVQGDGAAPEKATVTQQGANYTPQRRKGGGNW